MIEKSIESRAFRSAALSSESHRILWLLCILGALMLGVIARNLSAGQVRLTGTVLPSPLEGKGPVNVVLTTSGDSPAMVSARSRLLSRASLDMNVMEGERSGQTQMVCAASHSRSRT